MPLHICFADEKVELGKRFLLSTAQNLRSSKQYKSSILPVHA